MSIAESSTGRKVDVPVSATGMPSAEDPTKPSPPPAVAVPSSPEPEDEEERQRRKAKREEQQVATGATKVKMEDKEAGGETPRGSPRRWRSQRHSRGTSQERGRQQAIS